MKDLLLNLGKLAMLGGTLIFVVLIPAYGDDEVLEYLFDEISFEDESSRMLYGQLQIQLRNDQFEQATVLRTATGCTK